MPTCVEVRESLIDIRGLSTAAQILALALHAKRFEDCYRKTKRVATWTVRRGQFQPHVYERMMRAVDGVVAGQWMRPHAAAAWLGAEAMTHPPRPSAGLSESPIESFGFLDR
jgi:hypothetical protein